AFPAQGEPADIFCLRGFVLSSYRGVVPARVQRVVYVRLRGRGLPAARDGGEGNRCKARRNEEERNRSREWQTRAHDTRTRDSEIHSLSRHVVPEWLDGIRNRGAAASRVSPTLRKTRPSADHRPNALH